MQALPIDAVLPELTAALAQHRVAVLVAPPGAGKTTRVPGALRDARLTEGEIVVLQPRRLAARMAAARVAHERGGALGGEVGYEVRFDRKVSAATRLRFVTEGVLVRQLLADPKLSGVGAVLIDEFHERHLEGDLALALVARLRAERPELALLVMSATLDAEPVARFLEAPVVHSQGRMFPLTIEYLEAPDDRPLPRQVAAAVRRLVLEGLEGDVLVFLPGAGEIRKTAEELAELATAKDLLVAPLHGELSVEDQDLAVRPSPRRKVILATNVAETSITIDGVVAVVDSGLARVARHSPWSGLPSLQIEPVSRASCAQRAGRAGRTRPGRVLRLYTRHDHDTRRPFDVAEIGRSDLAGPVLELCGAGVSDLRALRWFESPPEAAVTAAEELLWQLGATARGGALTAMGRRMLRFPAHPRVARILCEAEDRGVAEEACLMAALLEARPLRQVHRGGPRQQAQVSSDSDIIDDVDAMLDARAAGMREGRLRDAGLDVGTAFAVHRAAQQLERVLGRGGRGGGGRGGRGGRGGVAAPAGDDELDQALKLALLTGYPDRVGKRRAPRASEIVFCGGGSATLSPSSAVLDAELLVAVDTADTGARGGSSKPQIRRASAIEASWLMDLYFDRITERDELLWNRERQRVERVVQLAYQGLVIDDHREPDGARKDPAGASAVLVREALAVGIERFVDADALARWRNRVALVAQLVPDAGVPSLSQEDLRRVLEQACQGLCSFDELRRASVLDLLDAQLGEHRRTVDRLAPTHLALPRRGRVAIHYEAGQPPWIASRMQDFFGLARAPAVGDGRVPLVLHLLAPNQRPVQVTQDLPGFWVKHYPALRKQLMRRYPKHAWPEDPTALVKGD
ncbi:MAG: ATP-dependent helicase HrpB [Myxococcales bacterium]|nr:ATP-dependent helicase HrpB [Myxococcales bacterium]